jgi:hypothetical protein
MDVHSGIVRIAMLVSVGHSKVSQLLHDGDNENAGACASTSDALIKTGEPCNMLRFVNLNVNSAGSGPAPGLGRRERRAGDSTSLQTKGASRLHP